MQVMILSFFKNYFNRSDRHLSPKCRKEEKQGREGGGDEEEEEIKKKKIKAR